MATISTLSPSITNQDTLQAWREQLLTLIARIALVLALPTAGLDMLTAIQTNDLFRCLINADSLLLLCLVALKSQINFNARAGMLLLLGYLLATGWLIATGLMGTGRLYFLALVVVAALFLSLRGTVLVWLLSLFTVGVVYAAFANELIPFSVVNDRFTHSSALLVSWFVQALVSGVLAGAVLLTVERLEQSLKAAESATTLLKYDNTELEKRVRERTAALQEREEAYRVLIENSLQGFVILQDKKVIFANMPAAHITGCTIEEMLSLSEAETIAMIHPEDREMVIQRGQDRLAGKDVPSHYAFRIIRKDGQVCWVEAHAIRIRYKGQPAVQMTYVDITERKEAEIQLRKFEQAVEQSASAIIITDKHNRIEYVNSAFTDLTGYTLAEVEGKSPERFFKSTLTPLETLRELWTALNAGNSWSGEFCNRKKNGELYWELARISPVYDENGTLTNFVAVKGDITSQKQAREEILRRDAVLQALSGATKQFLDLFDLAQTMPEVLKQLGLATHTSRVYVFENSVSADGRRLMHQCFEWCAPHIEPEIDNPMLQGLPYQEGGFARWEVLLALDKPIAGLVSTFPPGEQAVLVPQHIQSLIVVPIFVGAQWWGFIGFDDCEEERIWLQPEIEALKTTADIIGVAIERAQTDAALRLSEERYRTLANNLPDVAVMLFDHDMRLTLAEGMLLTQGGLLKETITGQTLREVFSPQTCDILEPVYRAALQGKPQEFERTHDDQHLLVRVVPICDMQGQVVAVMDMTLDLTEQKAMQEALRTLNNELEQRVAKRTADLERSQERNRALLDALPDSVFVFDRDGTIRDVEVSNPETFYIAPEEVIGSNLYAVMPTHVCTLYRTYVEQAWSSGQLQRFEYWLDLSIGKRDFEARLVVSASDQVLAIVRDITEMKHVEAALKVNEARYRTLVETSPDAIVLTDLDTTIRFCNGRAVELFGYTSVDELQGQLGTNLLTFPYTPSEFLQIVTDNNGIYIQEYMLYRKDGSRFPAEVHSATITNDQGVPIALTIVVHNIARRKQLQAQIIASERIAIGGRFAASIAHEINTPLQALQNFLHLVGRVSPDKRPKFLTHAQQEVQRIGRIVEQFLDLYRSHNVERGPVLVNEILTRLMLLLGKRIKEQKIIVERNGISLNAPVWGHTDELTQVFLNVLINALDAMPYGGRLSVACRESVNQLHVLISDTGEGIPDEKKQHLFDPFITTKEKGTGLGLYISHQIVQRHGGHILVDSREGEGTTFTIVLPTIHHPKTVPHSDLQRDLRL